MSYPQSGGYQQQPWQGGQQPGQQPGYGGGGGGYNYPAQTGGGNPATAIIAGVLGLAAAVLMAIPAFKMLSDLSDAPSGVEIPTEYTVVVVLLFVAAALCLIGSIITFVRKVAGAFVLLIGAIVVLAAILLQPPLLSSAFGGQASFGDFLEELFKFGSTEATCEAIGLIVAPFLLIFSVIPPTLNWLRSSSAGAQPYGGYPQQPQQGGYPGW